MDYREVALAGADLLDLVTDGARRTVLDVFLLQQAPLVEQEARRQVESLIDEINSQVSEHYIIRLVHEDTADFVEVLKVEPQEDE